MVPFIYPPLDNAVSSSILIYIIYQVKSSQVRMVALSQKSLIRVAILTSISNYPPPDGDVPISIFMEWSDALPHEISSAGLPLSKYL